MHALVWYLASCDVCCIAPYWPGMRIVARVWRAILYKFRQGLKNDADIDTTVRSVFSFHSDLNHSNMICRLIGSERLRLTGNSPPPFSEPGRTEAEVVAHLQLQSGCLLFVCLRVVNPADTQHFNDGLTPLPHPPCTHNPPLYPFIHMIIVGVPSLVLRPDPQGLPDTKKWTIHTNMHKHAPSK